MKQEPFRTHNYAAQVCIDSYDNRVLCGRLQSAAWDGDENFSSLMDFFCKMEQLLDQMLPTQAFTTRRTFCAVPPTVQPHHFSIPGAPGRLATFTVRILFRQNASWQGSILWREGGQEERFRSALELVLLMDSALRTLK